MKLENIMPIKSEVEDEDQAKVFDHVTMACDIDEDPAKVFQDHLTMVCDIVKQEDSAADTKKKSKISTTTTNKSNGAAGYCSHTVMSKARAVRSIKLEKPRPLMSQTSPTSSDCNATTSSSRSQLGNTSSIQTSLSDLAPQIHSNNSEQENPNWQCENIDCFYLNIPQRNSCSQCGLPRSSSSAMAAVHDNKRKRAVEQSQNKRRRVNKPKPLVVNVMASAVVHLPFRLMRKVTGPAREEIQRKSKCKLKFPDLDDRSLYRKTCLIKGPKHMLGVARVMINGVVNKMVSRPRPTSRRPQPLNREQVTSPPRQLPRWHPPRHPLPWQHPYPMPHRRPSRLQQMPANNDELKREVRNFERKDIEEVVLQRMRRYEEELTEDKENIQAVKRLLKVRQRRLEEKRFDNERRILDEWTESLMEYESLTTYDHR